MAIEFARIEVVGRGSGGNACRTGAYNARSKITDLGSNVTYNFINRGDNVYHEVLLPKHADLKFKDLAYLMNAVEASESRKDSQLLKSFVIALPDDKELSLEDRIEITKRIVASMNWVEEGLGVVIDVHEPHDGEKNWHAHGSVLTRRFTKDGLTLDAYKARDLNPAFCNGRIIPEEILLKDKTRDIINDYFKELGLDNRVDAISTVPGEHIGPTRMRSILNGAIERNELRAIAHLENIKDEHGVLDRVTTRKAVFTEKDLIRAVKEIDNPERRSELIERVLRSERVLRLYDQVTAEHAEVEGAEGVKGAEGKGFSKSAIKADQIYYTTKEVREEEQRCLRVAAKVNDLPNFGDTKGLRADVLRVKSAGNLVSEVQGKVLSDLLLADQGVRVLRGRAGTGKSHVLGLVRELSAQNGKHVIGLAPTHKAVEELQRKGFSDTDTVKGFLFKYKNGKNHIPSGSLVVVDEAGMIETSGMLELMKVARSRACNVILAGDERQNASIERGGMFEVFADRFGSSELSAIRRQDAAWGREMASCLARHDIKAGIKILEAHKGLRVSESLEVSMNRLIKDYVSSEYALNEKLVISLRNVEVDALNLGIREALKERGVIGGEIGGESKTGGGGAELRSADADSVEIKRDGAAARSRSLLNVTRVLHDGKKVMREYVNGERILFTATDKDYGVKNGEFATLTSVAKGQFVACLDNGNEVSFDPTVLHQFTYGYASTVYKAQGASIKFVAMLHNGIGNARNSYVALTRHVEQIGLYCNKEVTKSVAHLVRQLEGVCESSSSLRFVSDEDIANLRDQSNKQPGFFERIGGALKSAVVSIGDRVHRNPEYYQYTATNDKVSQVMVDDALEEVSMKSEMRNELGQEDAVAFAFEKNVHQKIAVGQSHSGSMAARAHNTSMQDNSGAATASKTVSKSIAKSGGASVQRVGSNSQRVITRYNKFDSEAEMAELKRAMGNGAELIACSLLGEPNRHLSNKATLRFGETGKIAVGISGSKSGAWYDFSEATGGDLIALVARERNCDFKGAKEYIGGVVGVSRSNVSYIHSMDADQRYKESISQDQKEKNVEASKIKRAQDLYMKAQTLATVTNDHIAKRYLTEHRGIERVLNEGHLSSDLQSTSMWDNHTKQHYESLVVMARSEKGEITGGQAIYLDKETANKADMPVNKRSFGKISGSFVTIQSGDEVKDDTRDNTRDDTRDDNKLNRATIIAEGVETALSIQEAGVPHNAKILCSLGVSNIKNYTPFKGEKILLCADNDGVGASSLKAIEGARNALEEKGAIVNVVMPKTAGADFNDVLKSDGTKAVHDQVNQALEGLARDNGLDRIVSKITTVCSDAKDEAANAVLSDHLSELKNLAPESLQSILDVCKSEGSGKGLETIDTILTNTKVQKQQQFASFLNYHTTTLKDIARLNPKIDTKALIEHLNHIGKDLTPKEALKVQNSHIDSVLVKSFQDKVIPELQSISKGFEEAKNPMDVMKTMQQEKALYSDIEKHYWNLSKVALTKDQHEKFMYNAVFHEDHPEYFKTLERDVSTLSKLDIWHADKITDTLKSESNFFNLEKKIFKGCQDHITHEVTKALHHIDEHKSIERDGHKFEDHKSYLEHRINDKDHGHYLTDTQPHKMLKQIYKVEQAKQEQQKELEMDKTMDKGHDMSM